MGSSTLASVYLLAYNGALVLGWCALRPLSAHAWPVSARVKK